MRPYAAMLRNLGAFMVGYVLLAALFVATEALTVAVAAGGMACLVCACVMMTWQPKTTPRVLEAVKAVTVTAVISFFAVAATETDDDSAHEVPTRFVALVGLLCCLPPLLMTSPAATVRSAPLVVLVYLGGALISRAGRRSFKSEGAPRALLLCVAAWLASLHAVRRRRVARRHFTAIELVTREEGRANWVLALLVPESVIAELKSGSSHCAKQFKEASVLFIEISDFAALSSKLPAGELVELLNFVFTTFDDQVGALGSMYKVETVGPVYVVSAGGLSSTTLASSFTTTSRSLN